MLVLTGCWHKDETPGTGQASKYYYEDIFEPFFKRLPGLPYWTTNREGAEWAMFHVDKREEYRVFVLGGSIAGCYMGHPDHLGAALMLAMPGRRARVINCGMSGYDSHREALVLDEILEMKPDLVVLMSGHNENIGSPPVSLWLLKVGDRIRRVKLLRELGSRTVDIEPFEAARRRDAVFAANLHGMLRRAKAAGVPMLVVSPPLNYRDAPSMLAAPETRPLFWAGWLRYLRGENEAAVAAWRNLLPTLPAAQADNGRSIVLFLLGRALERLGDDARAADFYRQALRDDWYVSGRCPPQNLDLIGRVTREEGAIWCDLDGPFREAGPRLPGLDVFVDSVHWMSARSSLVSLSLLRALRASPEGATLHLDPRAERRLERRAALARQPTSRESFSTLQTALNSIQYRRPVRPTLDAERHLSWYAVTLLNAVYTRRPRWFDSLERLERRAEGISPRLGAAWAMVSPKPPRSDLYWHAGEARLWNGEWWAALHDYDKALELDPGQRGAQLSRAVALTLIGRRTEAKAALAEAARLGAKDEALALGSAIASLKR